MRAISHRIERSLSFLESAENTIYRATIKALLSLRVKYLNLPGVAKYKALGSLYLCREVWSILDPLGQNSFITGGFAHDLKTGRLTRYHDDIDLALLDQGVREELTSLFRRLGFDVLEHGQITRLTKRGRCLDLFFWRKSGDGFCQFFHNDIMVRIPLACFCPEKRRFEGHGYQVASDEYMVFTENFVNKAPSKAFVARLKQGLGESFEHTESEARMVVRLHEYRLK